MIRDQNNTAFLAKKKTREGSVKIRKINFIENEKSDDSAESKPKVVKEQQKLKTTILNQGVIPRNFYTPRPPGVPDNYVWNDFLMHMVSKNSFPKLVYSDLVAETTEISYVIGNVALLLSLYYRLKNDLISSNTAIIMILLAIVCFYVFYWKNKIKTQPISKFLKDIKTLAVI